MTQTSSIKEFKASLVCPLEDSASKHVIENLFIYDLKVTPEEIWPFLSDTSRMNKELGLAPREETEVNGETHVSTMTLGVREEWVEKPWVWVHQNELQNHRIFNKGWMTEQRGVFKIEATGEGCRVYIYFRWSFPGLFKKLFFKLISKVLEKNFKIFFERKELLIKEARIKSPSPAEPLNEPASPYESFLRYLKEADDLELDKIQIKKISKAINLPSELLMEVSHLMVKEGLLSLSWDVLCPHCRGTRSQNQSLSYLEDLNVCTPCNIEFGLGEKESVEVVFHPTEKLRKISKTVYCTAEPAKKKHIKLNLPLAAAESKGLSLQLKDGLYRLRRKGFKDYVYINVDSNLPSEKVLWDGKTAFERNTGNHLLIELVNTDSSEVTYILEEAWWHNEGLNPGEVLSHPKFRDLFTEDHLKIGVKLNVGDQVIMFTDIVGSTPFYKSLGDAVALKAVKDHYNEVRGIIQEHQGIVVKYIGDAVMAAFLDLEDAFKASVEIQKKFHPDREDTPIRLRASLHRGPILCANVNVGVDYFGNTVNQSAKIQKWADAFEIAMAESDWALLREKYNDLKVKPSFFDEKLELEVRVLSVF